MLPMRRWGLVIAVATLAGCLSTTEALCTSADGTAQLVCPKGTACHLVDQGPVCATPGQVAACDTQQNGVKCDGGYCHDQVCVPVVCGDGRVDPGEQCDTARPGPCSPDCTSDYTCGNGVLDDGEQCDDDNRASHDGCDAYCQLELPHWIDLAGTPTERTEAAMAYDAYTMTS